jgi:PAS domain S-box-containing protein
MSTTKTKAQLELELKQAKKLISQLKREGAKGKPAPVKQKNEHILQSNDGGKQAAGKYTALIEHLPIVVYINPVNDLGYTLYVSPYTHKMLGYSSAELLADPKLWSKLLHPSDRNFVLAESKRILSSGESLDIEYRMITRDERTIWVHDEVVLVRDSAGQPQFWQGYLIDITERKQMGEALLESEARYRDLVENSHDLICTHDLEGNVLSVNDAAVNLTGFSREALMKMNLQDRLSPASHTAFKRYLRKIQARGWAHGEMPVLIANGETRIWEYDNTLRTEGVGKPIVRGMARDITERKKAEEELQKSEERYRSIAEDMPVMVCRFKADGTLTFINSFYCEYFNSTYEKLLGSNLFSLIPEHEHERVQKKYLVLNRENPYVTYEFMAVNANGMAQWQKWTYRALFDAQGQVVEYQSIGEDITERKQAEEVLKQSEERFQLLFKHSPDAIMLIDPHSAPVPWMILDCNEASGRINGYAREELIGKSIEILNSVVDNTPEGHANYLEVLRRSGTLKYETEHRRRDGTIFSVEVLTSIVTLAGRELVLGIDRDITERKQVEEALKEQEFWLRESQRVGRIGSYILDIESGTWTSSAILDDLFGIDADAEKTVESWNKLVLPQQRDEMLQYLKQNVIGLHESFNKEYQIVRARDGQVRWVWGQGELSMNEHGTPVRMFGTIQDITERKQAEMDLLKGEQRYRLLFENMPIAIWEEDFSLARKHLLSLKEQGIINFRKYFDENPESVVECVRMIQILDLNETALKMYAAKRKEDLIRSVIDDMSPRELELMREVLIGLAYGMTSGVLEGTDETLTGELMEVSLSWSVAPGYEQDYSRIIVTTTDITERKRAEAAISELKNRYETAIKASGQLLYDWHPDTNTVTYAGDIKRILGYTFEEMKGSLGYWVELIHPDDREIFNHEIEHVLAERTSFYLEYRVRRKNNTYMDVQDEGHFILDASGNIVQMLGFIRDVTERKAVEEKLEDSKKFFQYALDALSAHIAILDENGVITAVNRNWREFGRTNGLTLIGDGLGVNYLEICRASSGEGAGEAYAIAQAIQNMLANSEDQAQKVFEYPCHSPLENRWFVAGLTKFEEHGQPRVVVSHENITQRKLTEQNIERRVVELEALYQSGISFSQTLDEKDIGEKVIEILSGSLNWHHAAVRVRRGDTEYVELLASIHPGEVRDGNQRMQSAVSRVGVGLAGWVIQHGKSLRINNLNEDPRYVNTFAGMKSGLYIPMRIYDKTIGCISAESEQLDAFTEKDEHLLTTLANQAAIAIQNADLFKGIQNELARRREAEEGNLKQLARLTALQEIDRTIISTFDLQLSLTTLLSRALQILSVDAACVLLINTELNTLEYKSGLGFHTSVVQSTNLQMGESYAGIAAQERRMVRIPNMAEEAENLFRREFLQEEFVSYHGAPLIAKGKVIGVLEVFHRSFVERDDEWLDYFGTLAELAAIAIDNANLYSMSQHELAERKLAEEALLQSYAGLEWRVKERTADLKKANLDLEQALRIKDEFLASMSHELRTPLNAIIGLSESLAEQVAGPLNEKQQRYIHTIGESGHHLLELINDILDLAKIEAGYMELNINLIQVEMLCQSSIRMIKELAQKKSLLISFEMESNALTVSGDERKLKQTLVNLLGNAVKFTPAGGNIGLKVTTHPNERAISFTVWDNGIGIAADQIPLLFKPFVQLDGGLSREYAGTGLGLALVDKMINLHGGTVSVESEKDRGSSFTITLPWESQSLPAAAEKMPQSVETSTKVRGRGVGSILLVEDTEEIIILLNDYLTHKGYTVSIARNGAEGVIFALQEQPDLILMDVMMPIMDGLQATRKIRTEPTLKDIPIIGLTSLAMPGDYDNCIAAGMTNYISKPVELKKLISMITQYLTEDGKSDK